MRVTASPISWTGSRRTRGAPRLYRVGEHTREVLSGVLGYEAERIAELLGAGIIEAPLER